MTISITTSLIKYGAPSVHLTLGSGRRGGEAFHEQQEAGSLQADDDLVRQPPQPPRLDHPAGSGCEPGGWGVVQSEGAACAILQRHSPSTSAAMRGGPPAPGCTVTLRPMRTREAGSLLMAREAVAKLAAPTTRTLRLPFSGAIGAPWSLQVPASWQHPNLQNLQNSPLQPKSIFDFFHTLQFNTQYGMMQSLRSAMPAMTCLQRQRCPVAAQPVGAPLPRLPRDVRYALNTRAYPEQRRFNGTAERDVASAGGDGPVVNEDESVSP